MSLLNQVLQDLEKRNAEDTPDQKQLNQVKAVSPTHKKSALYLITLLFLIGIIAATSYFIMDKESSEKAVIAHAHPVSSIVQSQNSITKQTTDLLDVKNSLASEQGIIKTDIQSLPELQLNKTTTTQPIKDHTTDDKTQQQPINSPPKRIKKIAQINKIKPYKQQKRKPVKKLSNKQHAEKVFTLAKNQKNNTDQQEKLRQTLQLNPKHIEARLLLANSFLNIGMTSETVAVLDQGLQLFPLNSQFINFRSQLFLQNQQPQAALNILQRINSDYNQDEMYLSLLAAANQQNNDHLNSLQTYQKLLSINPEKAEYWLGLAIALEKQGNTDQALIAYQYALDKKSLKSAIVSYINQRVSLLK